MMLIKKYECYEHGKRLPCISYIRRFLFDGTFLGCDNMFLCDYIFLNVTTLNVTTLNVTTLYIDFLKRKTN